MIFLKQGDIAEVVLEPTVKDAATWTAQGIEAAKLVELMPLPGGRACRITARAGVPLGMGRVTIKAADSSHLGVGYFAVAIYLADEPTGPEAAPMTPAEG